MSTVRPAGVPRSWAVPALLGAAVFFALPLGWIVMVSLQRGVLGGEATWAGLDTVAAMLTSPRWWGAAGYTLALAAVIIPLELGLGLALGAALARTRRPVLAQLSLLMPWAVSPLVTGLLVRWVSSPSDGVLATLAGRRLGLLATPEAVPVLAVAAVLWQSVGFTALCYAAALRTVPAELRNAARLDGAGALRILLRIEVPHVRRMTGFLAVASFGGVVGLYDVLVVLPDGPSPTLAQLLVQTVWQEFDVSAGAAMALGTMALMAVVIGIGAVLTRERS